MNSRIERERRIINIMINQYCHDVHHSAELCPECYDLLEYSENRLLSCPFLDNKPVCSKCSIHCYKKNKKEQIKEVMLTVGPKMIYTNTWLTLWYMFYKLLHKNQKVK